MNPYSPDGQSVARYVMIGGFLGAGKSTALARMAHRLTRRGLRVGLITNDQASGLVDSRTLRAQGFAVEEIAGGCFCCRFNSLLAAASKLAESDRPDVFLAEPVGSCTDLVATVSYPLRRIYGDGFRVAPLSVLVDPVRAARVLGLEEGRSFSRKVAYVYEKQLEEADYIVVNKCDILPEGRRVDLREALASRFPRAEIFEVSARDGIGCDEWFDRLEREEMRARDVLEIDYDIYAEGEALLGWLNATLELRSDPTTAAAEGVDGNTILRELSDGIQSGLGEIDGEVAHLKMTLSPDDGVLGEIAVVNLVRQDHVPEICQELPDRISAGQVILNLRAEAPPQELRRIVGREIDALNQRSRSQRRGVEMTLEHVESFRPARPEPTHRDTAIGSREEGEIA